MTQIVVSIQTNTTVFWVSNQPSQLLLLLPLCFAFLKHSVFLWPSTQKNQRVFVLCCIIFFNWLHSTEKELWPPHTVNLSEWWASDFCFYRILNSLVQSIFANKRHSFPKLGTRRYREDAPWHPRGTKPGADRLAADQRSTEFKGWTAACSFFFTEGLLFILCFNQTL